MTYLKTPQQCGVFKCAFSTPQYLAKFSTAILVDGERMFTYTVAIKLQGNNHIYHEQKTISKGT